MYQNNLIYQNNYLINWSRNGILLYDDGKVKNKTSRQHLIFSRQEYPERERAVPVKKDFRIIKKCLHKLFFSMQPLSLKNFRKLDFESSLLTLSCSYKNFKQYKFLNYFLMLCLANNKTEQFSSSLQAQAQNLPKKYFSSVWDKKYIKISEVILGALYNFPSGTGTELYHQLNKHCRLLLHFYLIILGYRSNRTF